ncbi:MAG TPA: hypothetical protein VL981_06195 [Candidatus Methylacidiphilales bacterium]|nr:hypothetical protein [Candidatus Methylacidiphilales bacterium]
MKLSFKYPATKSLRVAMRKADLTGRLLAERAGIGLSTIQKILAEIITPGPRVTVKIEAILGRIWSSPVLFRQRKLLATARRQAREIIDAKGLSERAAYAAVATKYPALGSILKTKARKRRARKTGKA